MLCNVSSLQLFQEALKSAPLSVSTRGTLQTQLHPLHSSLAHSGHAPLLHTSDQCSTDSVTILTRPRIVMEHVAVVTIIPTGVCYESAVKQRRGAHGLMC